jgi:inorganic phosphate transporter, PiT family
MTPAASLAEPNPPRLGDLSRFLIALGFLFAVTAYTWFAHGHISLTLVVAAAIGAYMAMNVGANDVANNVGPAVGARAMTLTRAVLIAAVFEALGAFIAGGNVVGTIKSGIIDPVLIDDPSTFIWLMMAALLAGAVWLNAATMVGAPVSTTHSIVGGVLGAGVAAAGWTLVNWATIGQIVLSWIVSPLFGGIIAALFLYAIKRTITYQSDLRGASQRMVPVLLALMAWAFATFLMIKGLGALLKLPFVIAFGGGFVIAVLTWLVTRGMIERQAARLDNHKDSVNALFMVPLMFAAALLSFAHGSNDVANAIGPLAAINSALLTEGVAAKATVPIWIMVLGALGLAVGLALYGPRVIRTVGSEITEMDPMRAYCIALAATITVSIASQLGLPISTTHVTIGAVFGVGFLREYLKSNYQRILAEIEEHHRDQEAEHEVVEQFLQEFESADFSRKTRMLKKLKKQTKRGESYISKRERKDLRKVHRKVMVRRSVMMKIIAAWIITVPASALMAAGFYFMIRGAMIP